MSDWCMDMKEEWLTSYKMASHPHNHSNWLSITINHMESWMISHIQGCNIVMSSDNPYALRQVTNYVDVTSGGGALAIFLETTCDKK